MRKLLLFTVVIALIGCGEDSPEKKLKKNKSINTVRCQELMQKQLNFPKTYNQHWTDGINHIDLRNGEYMIKLRFSAKNAFGVEKDYIGYCSVENGIITSANIE